MSRSIQSILVPTDGSEGAQAGARRGVGIADAFGADLHVLSVFDTREADLTLSSTDSKTHAEHERQLEQGAQRAVDAVAGLARGRLSGRITTAVEEGIPHQAINEYASTHGVDVIVMGTQGRTGLERVVLGSVAERTLRTASVPVVTVSPGADVEDGDEASDTILLPTDGSEGAEIAVEWGITLAEAYDASIHTVYSVDTSRFAGADGMGQIHEALEETGRDALESVRERARAADLSVASYIGSGPAARMILSYTDEHDVDMIVMGTHGRSGIRRYLIGSVTETVVRNAAVPVCAVPMNQD